MLDFNVTIFNSTQELNSYVTNYNWGKDGYPKLCFAFSFNSEGNSKYNYSLHYFDALPNSQADKDIPNQLIPSLDPFQYGPDLTSFRQWTTSGYLNMMTIINNLILNLESSSDNKQINVAMSAQKYYSYKEDPFAIAVGFILPFFLVIAYTCPLGVLVFRMVSDKV